MKLHHPQREFQELYFFIITLTDFFECNRTDLLQRGLGNVCMHCGHGYCLIVIIPRVEITEAKENLQIPLEVFVEEPIKDWVHASRDHGREMAEQKQQVVAAGCWEDFVIPVKDHVKNGER